jgi:acylphosphatase
MDEEAEKDLSAAVPEGPLDYPEAHGKQAEVEGHNSYLVRVTGRVQGVFYRDFARRTAESLMICGWVRNEPDGSVAALLQSPETRLIEMMIERLKEGPPNAQVEEVFVEQVAGEPLSHGFVVRR